MTKNTIYEVELLDLLPSSIKNDPDIIAASKAIDTGFFLLANSLKQLVIIPRIEFQNSDVLDHIAYFFHVDFYDVSFDVETKRKLILESVYLHQIKGTPRAVEILIETLFDEGIVEEWYEYGDTPYRFRIVTSNQYVTDERAEEFIRALDSVKNKRSHLDSVVILQAEQMNLNFAGVVHQGIYEEYRQVN